MVLMICTVIKTKIKKKKQNERWGIINTVEK
jgi:hypothetical protein